MQNITLYDDTIRMHTVEGSQLLAAEDPTLDALVSDLVLYDFMSDIIRRGRDIDQLYVVPIGAISRASSMPTGTMAVIKGKGTRADDGTVRGGEIIPLVGHPADIYLAIRGISDYRQNKPTNTLATLRGQKDLVAMMEDPKYSNPLIEVILDSYTKSSISTVEDTKLITKITNRLRKPLPEGKAINVTKGTPVNATSSKYMVQELSVTIPGEAARRVVKFAFPTNLRPEEREEYSRMLRDTYSAEPGRSTTISEDERRTIGVRPIRLTSHEYAELFNTNESFSSYINNITAMTQGQLVDTSQILHPELRDEEDDIDEDIDEL